MYDLGDHLAGLEVRPGANVLITGPPLVGKRRLGLRTLATGCDDAVVVTTREGAPRVRDEYRALAEPREPLHVVDAVTEHVGRSADASATRYVASPAALTDIGVACSEQLRRCHDDGGRTRLLLDSLTPPLLYSTLRTVFRFAHRLCSRVENASALGLYTVTATAHGTEVLNTLAQLFDARIDLDADGTATVDLPGSEPRTVDR